MSDTLFPFALNLRFTSRALVAMDWFLLPMHLFPDVECGYMAIVLKGEEWYLWTLKQSSLHAPLHAVNNVLEVWCLLGHQTLKSEGLTPSQVVITFKAFPLLSHSFMGGYNKFTEVEEGVD